MLRIAVFSSFFLALFSTPIKANLVPSAIVAPEAFQLHDAAMPELAKWGPHKVGVKTLNVVNPAQLDVKNFKLWQDRPLTLEIWYPAQPNDTKRTVYNNETRTGQPFAIAANAHRDAPGKAGDYPLVVLSHGYTGYRTIMFYLAEHLASHGYVIASIDHTDSTNQDVDFVNEPYSGFVSTLYNRARDQQFVLDYLTSVQGKAEAVNNLDTSKAAVIGFSMGGFGAINSVGGCFDFSSDTLKKLGFPTSLAYLAAPILSSCNAAQEQVDKRWKGMIAFAPWGQTHNIHSESSLRQITVPSLIVAGSKDDISGYETGVKKIFDLMTGNDKFMLVYENARHNIATHPAPSIAYTHEDDYGHYADPVWRSETINQVNNHMSLAFLNCYVKEEPESCNFLPQHGQVTEKQPTATSKQMWPGFKDRWAVGMRFYRK